MEFLITFNNILFISKGSMLVLFLAGALVAFLIIILIILNKGYQGKHYMLQEENIIHTVTKILLVDDNVHIRRSIRSLLGQKDGIEIVGEVENGQLALDHLAQNNVDIVMMDVRMPIMDGVEATRLVRKHSPKTRVLALSMYDDRTSVNAMISQGAAGYVLKGDNEFEILNAINTIKKGGVYFSQGVIDNY